MRFLSLLIFFFIGAFTANAQFGVALKYDINRYDDWNESSYFQELDGTLDSTTWFDNNLTLGFNYSYKTKDQKIKFLPELLYSFKNREEFLLPFDNRISSQYRFGLKLNTQLYLFDFIQHSDNPYWDKLAMLFKHHLFILISPGLDHITTMNIINDKTNVQLIDYRTSSLSGNFGVGTGIDIPIGKWITLSPFAMLNYYPILSGDHIGNIAFPITRPTNQSASNSKNRQIQTGLRFSYTPDYKN